MYVYIWKDQSGIPFYVGCTKSARRTNPRNEGNRNWLCVQKIAEIGVDNVVVEIRHVTSIEEGRSLEKQLIDSIGRININTGTLTNLRPGGDGLDPMSDAHKEKLRAAMTGRKASDETKDKLRKRMKDPDVQKKMRGDNNPAKRPEVREKLKDLWKNEDFRTKATAARKKPRTLAESTKQVLRQRIKANPAMKAWSERNGDPEFEAKRIAGLMKVQDKIREKLNDPEAKTKRIAKLMETINSPEYKERRKSVYTPEVREKQSAAKKAYWERKRAEKIMK